MSQEGEKFPHSTKIFGAYYPPIIRTYVDININRQYKMVCMGRVRSTSYRTTIRVRDSCLCLHVQRAARTLARHFDNALRPLGLTNGQFSLMMSLNRPDAPTIGAVASLLAMDRTTLTAALKPLKRRRLINITTDNRDQRARVLELTPQGRNLLTRAVAIWTNTHTAVEARLGAGDADRLRKNLRTLS